METRIQKQIIDYFSFFEEFYNTSKTCLKTCQKCAISINTLIERCRYILQAQTIGTPLEQFENLQKKLSAVFHNLIQEDIIEIEDQQSIVDESFEKLCHKHKVLTESCKAIDTTIETALVKGTPLQPPLKRILEFATDTLTFGGQVYAQIEASLNVLEFKKLNTEPQVENFKVSAYWSRRIGEILAYTSFCAENEI